MVKQKIRVLKLSKQVKDIIGLGKEGVSEKEAFEILRYGAIVSKMKSDDLAIIEATLLVISSQLAKIN